MKVSKKEMTRLLQTNNGVFEFINNKDICKFYLDIDYSKDLDSLGNLVAEFMTECIPENQRKKSLVYREKLV